MLFKLGLLIFFKYFPYPTLCFKDNIRIHINQTLVQVFDNTRVGFGPGLNQIELAFWEGWTAHMSFASIEFYLRALTTADISMAMGKSTQYGYNSASCP
jgi:hypothetical protein